MTEEWLPLYAGSKLLHFSLPWVNRINLLKFKVATLKPKNCFVFNFPLTGISSTTYLFLRTDTTVSTPLQIRPICISAISITHLANMFYFYWFQALQHRPSQKVSPWFSWHSNQAIWQYLLFLLFRVLADTIWFFPYFCQFYSLVFYRLFLSLVFIACFYRLFFNKS